MKIKNRFIKIKHKGSFLYIDFFDLEKNYLYTLILTKNKKSFDNVVYYKSTTTLQNEIIAKLEIFDKVYLKKIETNINFLILPLDKNDFTVLLNEDVDFFREIAKKGYFLKIEKGQKVEKLGNNFKGLSIEEFLKNENDTVILKIKEYQGQVYFEKMDESVEEYWKVFELNNEFQLDLFKDILKEEGKLLLENVIVEEILKEQDIIFKIFKKIREKETKRKKGLSI